MTISMLSNAELICFNMDIKPDAATRLRIFSKKGLVGCIFPN